MKKKKLLLKILTNLKNVKFNEFVTLVEAFGCRLSRTRGSHHILTHRDIEELINLQNVNGQAKPYLSLSFPSL